MPDWSKEIRALLTGLALEPTREFEIVEELGQHCEDRYEELLSGGALPEQARREVLDELAGGKLESELRRAVKPARPEVVSGNDEPGNMLWGLFQDLLHGARLLRVNPGFAAVAILSLALGIGANTAIFQLIDAVRLRALPVEDPQRLADVRTAKNPYGRTGMFMGENPQLTNAIWEHLRDGQQAFSSIAAWGNDSLNMSAGGEARYAETLWVSGSFFGTLGVRPVAGRLTSGADDRPGCGSPGVVLSEPFWKREFGGRLPIVGTTIPLAGRSFEIIGVTPASFFGVEVGRRFDVALPICAEALVRGERQLISDPQAWWLASIGRLKPGQTAETASAQLASISRGLFEATLPAPYDVDDAKHYLEFKLVATPAASGVSALRRRYETPLWLLLSIAGLVLLIACANLANLMVARAGARQREMAVRLALGASRARLVRQLLAENILLAFLGASAGIALAQALSRALLSFLSTQDNSLSLSLGLDARVLAFTAALALLTCILFGVAPAIQAARTSPGEAMKGGGRGTTAGRDRRGLRRALVVSQVALSLVLLVGALLFVGTLRNLTTMDTGFRKDQLLVTSIDLSPLKVPVERRAALKKELLGRLQGLPGVQSAASAWIIPVTGQGWNDSIVIPNTEIKDRVANFNRVSPAYFRTMGTPLLAGRDFSDGDTLKSPQVAVVTETFARRYLGGASPIGRTFGVAQQSGKPNLEYQVVGLVKDMKYTDLREEFTPIVYVAEAQDPEPGTTLRVLLRSEVPLPVLSSSVKGALAEVNPAIVLRLRVFQTIVREGMLRERLMATLSGFFGFLAAILAMIGLYGVISYTVVRRRNEIGVRIALGASARNILSLIMREAATLLAVGLAIGTALALLAGKAASALLYGLKASDLFTMAAAVTGLAAVALLASFLPARRAAALDPMRALRED
jgi:putative ABC transport system permease protein